MSGTTGRLNIASCLTLSRLFLLPVTLLAVCLGLRHGPMIAACLATVAAVTDMLDGYVARRLRQVTALGTKLDLAADKLFVAAIMIMLAYYSVIPVWMPAVVILRETVISLVRLRLWQTGQPTGPDALGKAKTATSMVAIVWLLLQMEQYPGGWLSWAEGYAPVNTLLNGAPWVMLLAVALTVLSGANYLVRYAGIIGNGKRLPPGDMQPTSRASAYKRAE